MKPMTKERLEELRLKIERELSRFKGMNFFESEWASEMNECLSEIQRLRGALEKANLALGRISYLDYHQDGECKNNNVEMCIGHIAHKALSPSDETEVTK